MQARTPPPSPEPGGNTASIVLKIVLVVALIGLGASLPRLFTKKPAEVPPPAEAEAPAPEAAEVAPAKPKPQAFQFRNPAKPRATQAGQADSANPPVTQGAGNAPATAGVQRDMGFLMTSRLPELRLGVEGVVLRFEPQVFYRVPGKYGEELSNTLAEIRSATNVLLQLDAEFKAVYAGAAKDHQDYVGAAKAANAQRQVEAAAALKKLEDLQALYMERKRAFVHESASLKPTLQDPLEVAERKLPLYQKATQIFERDINQLEAAIAAVTKQVQATAAALRANDNNITKAYELSAQDVVGQLTVLSNRVQGKLGEVNGDIRAYNAMLGRYGSPLHTP